MLRMDDIRDFKIKDLIFEYIRCVDEEGYEYEHGCDDSQKDAIEERVLAENNLVEYLNNIYFTRGNGLR